MNRPSVARTCSHCSVPITNAAELRYHEGKSVSSGCLRAIAAAKANADALVNMPTEARKQGAGALRALERRKKDAEANAALRAKRAERAVLEDGDPKETTTT